jgi:hypothetical protein
VIEVSEYLEQNRRAVIMLIVAVCIALLGGLYLLLFNGGQEEEVAPIPHNNNPSAVQDADPAADESEAVESIYVARGTSVNPFGPLAGAQKQKAEKSTSDAASESTTSKSTPNSNSTKQSTTQSSPAAPKNSSVGTKEPAPPQTDPGNPSEPDDPQPVVPEPIGGPGKDGEELLVRVLEVQPELMTARVNGERTKLYLNEPNELGGLTYLAPLGGGCAWVGMPDTEVRFSVCKGKTERL